MVLVNRFWVFRDDGYDALPGLAAHVCDTDDLDYVRERFRLHRGRVIDMEDPKPGFDSGFETFLGIWVWDMSAQEYVSDETLSLKRYQRKHA